MTDTTAPTGAIEAKTDRPLLVVFPRGQLDPLDKAQMREAGILANSARCVQAIKVKS